MSRTRVAIALSCGALALLSGCGGGSNGSPIPASTASRLIRNIQAADSYSANGQCGRAHTKVRDARFVYNQIPSSVDKDVRQGIADGLSRLDSLITSECAQPQKTQTETTQTDTTPTTTPSTTTPTTTTPSTTTPTTTTPTSTTPTTTTTTTTTTGTTTTGNGGTPPPPSGAVDGGTG